MPSWLTSGAPQTNATPLAPSRKRPPPKELDHPRRSSKPALDRPSSSASPNLPCAPAPTPQPQPPSLAVQNASNPASPALPNVVASQTSQSSANDNNILPSPAPSEDLSAGRGRGVTIVSLGDEDEEEEEEEEEESNNAGSRTVEGAMPDQRRSTSLAVPEASPRDNIPAIIPAQVEQTSAGEDGSRAEHSPHSTIPRAGSPPNPGNGAMAQSPRDANEHNGVMSPHDSRRWRTLPPPGTSCFAPDYLLQELQFLNDICGDGKGLSAVESVRADLVREAISIRDYDYLRFHQLMCLRALSAHLLPPELSRSGNLFASTDLLNHLVQTREVSNAWLKWFADFPVKLETMKQRWPDEYDRAILHFKQFVALAPTGWDKLQKACWDKTLPPTAVEIRKELGVSSHLLQSIFNRAIFRSVCSLSKLDTQQQLAYMTEGEAAFKDHQLRLHQLRITSPITQLSIDEMNEEKRYREKINSLRTQFAAQVPRQDSATIQARRMSRQMQISQGQQSDSPVLQTHPNSPAQQNQQQIISAPQNPVQLAAHHAISPQQGVRPPVQISVTRPQPTSSQMVQLGGTTPTSTLPSSHLASVQNMSRMAVYQNQQQVQQPIQTSSPMMGPPNTFAMNATAHSPISQQWAQGHPQSPISSPFPSPAAQQYGGQPIYRGMPGGAIQQQMHQRRQSGPVQQQGYQPQVHPQQVLRSNSTPSMVSAQAPRPIAPQVNSRQTNGNQRSPVQPQHSQAQPFVPPLGYIWQPQVIDSSQSALHQAHLRSPVLKAMSGPEAGRKLYQSVVSFALPPTRLADRQAHQSLPFWLSPEDRVTLPTEKPATLGKPRRRLVAEGSKLYRLRCARSKSTGEHEWVLEDTIWPGGMFLTLNGQILEMRKKLQHGKDFPIDITRLLRPGENQLEINLLRRPNEEKASSFMVAVEVIAVQHYDKIKTECASNKVIPAEEILSSIKGSLTGPGDDDDVAIVDSNVTVNLFDPFTNCRPCDMPVRGKHCLHRDCFDLDIFLQTRDRRQPHSPSLVDVWRCPICRGDVRPKSLIVDGFLLEVHKELSMMGQLDTRAIIIDSEGKWKPKPEEKKDDPPASKSSSPVDNNRARTTSAPVSQAPTRTSEVIELD